MKCLPSLALASAVALVCGCDKAGSWIEGGALGNLPDVVGQTGGKVDEDLAALVKRSDEGVSFRRDIPYPTTLKGKLNVRLNHTDVLFVETSELGKHSERMNHTAESELAFDKKPGLFELRLTKNGRRILTEKVKKKEEEQAEAPRSTQDRVEDVSAFFRLTDKGWSASRKESKADFKSMVWTNAIQPEVQNLMVEMGAHPRAQWFSSSRSWSPGDRVVLTGSVIRLLYPFDVSGRIVLVFEKEEAVDGHPCGVFSVEGNMELKGHLEFGGSRGDAAVSMKTGKIWASLLHPIILREEYETVQTITRWPGESRSGPSTKIQGAIGVTKVRSWSPENS